MMGRLRSGWIVKSGDYPLKFKQLVGEPPTYYLTRLRLTTAAATLRTRPTPLVDVALSIGYDSEVAFGKAFKR